MSLKVHIKKDFGAFKLNVDFENETDALALLGKSGSGKSLTLKCIAGLEKPDEGYIELNGRVLFDSSKKVNLSPQKRNVGYLFQNYALFPNMTVVQNIQCGLCKFKGNKEEKEKKIESLISLFHLNGLEKHKPHQLSGGEQQRVALARILATDPEILLLDEPFSALDAFLRNKLQMELKGLLKKYSKQTILVSHDRDEAYLLSNEIVLMDSGKTIVQNNTKELFNNPIYLKAAILTGCKNFSKVEVIDQHHLHLIDWGFNLELKEVVPSDIKYIGIRAHYFSSKKQEYSQKIEIIDITEETFNYLIRFRFINQDSSSELVYWKVDKNIKTIEENNTVGIIICRKNNKYVIEFCSDERIIAREYELV